MEYIISAVWVLLELLSYLLFCGAFLKDKRKKRHTVIVAAYAWLIMCIYPYSGINSLLKQTITIGIVTSVSMFSYKGKWLTHLLLVILSYIFIVAIDTVTVVGTSALLGVSYSEFVWRKLTYVTTVTLGKLLELLFAWLLCHYKTASGLHLTGKKWLVLSLLFPLASVSMLAIWVLGEKHSGDISVGTVVYSGILASANVAMLYIISSLEKATKQEQDMLLLEQQIALQSENYSVLQSNYTTQRKATHEFERHLQTLGDLLDQNEYAAASDYLHQLQNNRTLQIFSVKSNHPVFDVILNQKHQLALEHEIKMQIQVNDLSEVFIQTDALVVLLSNVLDNAIEACRRLPEKKEIYCSVLYDDGLYISVRNTSLPVDIADDGIATSKADRTEHGYGIPAVKYVLEQLGAEYTFDYQDGWFQFATEIAI